MHRVGVSRAMRRTTEDLIALQFLMVILPVTLLLLALLVAGTRRTPALAHSPPWRNLAAAARANHWTFNRGAIFPHCLTRMFHHRFSVTEHGHGPTLALDPPVHGQENSHDQ